MDMKGELQGIFCFCLLVLSLTSDGPPVRAVLIASPSLQLRPDQLAPAHAPHPCYTCSR